MAPRIIFTTVRSYNLCMYPAYLNRWYAMPPKRKAAHLENGGGGGGDATPEPEGALRRSTRRKPQAAVAAAAVKDENEGRDVAKESKSATSKAAAGAKTRKKTAAKLKHGEVKASNTDTTAESSANNSPADSSEKSYWLMKAEPESRFENGTDVKFSIDDLASRTEPEPWDGV